MNEPELFQIYTPLYFADIVTAIIFLRFLKDFIVSLHQYIKDKKYLVGNQLQNADETEADLNNNNENGGNNHENNHNENYVDNNNNDDNNHNPHNDQAFNHDNDHSDEGSNDNSDSNNDVDYDSKSDDFIDQEPLGSFLDEMMMQHQRRKEI